MFKYTLAAAATVSAFDAMYQIEGLKGFYMGAYSALYMDISPDMANCLNSETADNLVTLWHGINGPGAFFHSITDIENDFVIFDAYAEVVKDIADCHFENALLDLQHFCEPEDVDCSISTLISNGKSNMFGLMG